MKKEENPLYKTSLCRHFVEEGHCAHGKRCSFAHGESELRELPHFHHHGPKNTDRVMWPWGDNKTPQNFDDNHGNQRPKFCKFWPIGRCKNGGECGFWHGEASVYKEKYGFDPEQLFEGEKVVDSAYQDHENHPPGYVDLKKTKICSYWLEGKCKSGSGCHFAHGEHELVASPVVDGARPGDWPCPKCRNNCFASRTECLRCGAPKPNGTENFGASDVSGGVGYVKKNPMKSTRLVPPPPPSSSGTSFTHPTNPAAVSPPTIDVRMPQDTDPEAWRRAVHAMETDDLHGFRLALQGIVKASSLAQKASTTHRNNVLSSNAFAAIGSTANDDEEASTQSPRKLNLLPKATLTACVNIICIALGNTGLLKVLLEFWNEPDHGCWTLLLSAGPVSSDENSGHYCVLLHDLVRRSAPVSSPPSGHHLNAASIIEIVGLVVKTRPCSLFDHNQEGHSPLYAALYHKAPSLVAVSVAPLTHIPHDVSSPLFRRAKVLQEQVLLIAMEKESEWDLPPKYLTDLVLRDLMGQIEKSYEVEQNLQWDELVSGKRQGNESKVDQMLREQSEATRVKETRPPQSNLHELLGLSERQILPSPTSSPMLRSSGGSGGLPFAVPLPSLQQTSQPSIPSLAHIPPPAPYNPFAKRAPPIK